ncbi:hypothetical protein LTS10_013195 [Elasticomyces elasticus]|nr:hypothetical protein LTS10_013195 [Elasticomyces elasticus]
MLSASQLERKCANDREAQRAIRQRMKKHIESLETSVGELRGSQESNEKIVAVTQQRNRDLEAEIAYLRSKFHEGGHEAEAPLMDGHRQFGEGVLSAHLTSRVNLASATSLGIKRPTLTSTSRNLSVATGSTGSWYGSLQQQSSFLPSALTSAATMPDQKSAGGERCLIWGPHDASSSGHTMQAPPPQVQEPLRPPHSAAYRPVYQSEIQEWVGPTQQYHHQEIVGFELQKPQRSETQQRPLPASQSVHHQYVQPPIQSCTPTPSPPLALQQQIDPSAQLPPQAANQGRYLEPCISNTAAAHIPARSAATSVLSPFISGADPGLSGT